MNRKWECVARVDLKTKYGDTSKIWVGRQDMEGRPTSWYVEIDDWKCSRGWEFGSDGYSPSSGIGGMLWLSMEDAVAKLRSECARMRAKNPGNYEFGELVFASGYGEGGEENSVAKPHNSKGVLR